MAVMARFGERWMTAAAWTYGIVLTLWVLCRWILSQGQINDPGWLLLMPLQAVSALVALDRLHRLPLSRSRRLGWTLLLAAFLVDMLAIVDWNYVFANDPTPLGTFADVLYFANYALLTSAAAAFFVSCGGAFSNPRIWLDAATLVLGATAGLLPFFFAPMLGDAAAAEGSLPVALAYGVGIVVTGTMTLLLFMQLGDWREQRAMVAVIAAIAVMLTTDVASIAANLRGHFRLANLDDLGAGWSYVLFISAALLERKASDVPAVATPGNPYSFVPVFAILVSLSLVLGAETLPTLGSRLAAAIVVFGGAGLLLVRQLGIRQELARLSAAVVTRDAEARLSELMRSSSDLILAVDPAGRITYASPSSGAWLGEGATHLQGSAAQDLLGPTHEAALAALLQDARRAVVEPVLYEGTIDRGSSLTYTIQVLARSATGHPHIGGLVLTIRDVTEHRATERALFEVAALKQRALSREMHEGLAQDLAGIGYVLQGLARRPPAPAALGAELGEATGQLQRLVGELRTLAREISPLAVVQDSLVAALATLAEEVRRRRDVAVIVRADRDSYDEVAARESLYLVAREAIERAAARPGCRTIEVGLALCANDLELTVLDDAPGGVPSGSVAADRSLRIMRHRMRLAEGLVRVDAGPSGGTRVLVRVPLRSGHSAAHAEHVIMARTMSVDEGQPDSTASHGNSNQHGT
jgi:PAS domain S-box-containing protein